MGSYTSAFTGLVIVLLLIGAALAGFLFSGISWLMHHIAWIS